MTEKHWPGTDASLEAFKVVSELAGDVLAMKSAELASELPLTAVLARITELTEKKAAASAELKRINVDLEHLENIAAEQIRLQGFDGCRAAGRSWWVQDTLRISVPKEARAAVLDAAEREGIRDELVTVAVPTLKAWLTERAKDAGKEEGASFLTGTAFEGIGISEYVASELRSRAV